VNDICEMQSYVSNQLYPYLLVKYQALFVSNNPFSAAAVRTAVR